MPRHEIQYRRTKRSSAMQGSTSSTVAWEALHPLPTGFTSIALPGICFEQAFGMGREAA